MQKITGGERVGNNLFHSFKEFSIPARTETFFENAADIESIFILIASDDNSVIDGLIQTVGRANLFLVNPNGIVFGENAQLDIGGSFLATTADNIEFADGVKLLTQNADTDTKFNLSATFPVRLNLTDNNGNITVNGSGNQISNQSLLVPIEFAQNLSELSLNKDQTLALIGNGITFNGGIVTTKDGNVYLSSVEYGSIEISQSENRLNFLAHSHKKYQNVDIDQKSLISLSSSSEKLSSISIVGKNINIKDASFVLAQNHNCFSNSSIKINASETLNLSVAPQSDNLNLRSSIRSETLDLGEGANINISANRLALEDGAMIRTYSFSDGIGGSIKIDISHSIELFPPSSIIATTYSKGNAGNINLSASELHSNIGGISSSTFGDGNGGMIEANIDLIEITGNSSGNRGNIAATSWATGNAGNVSINTSQLILKGGASLSSSSFAHGNAGNISISASRSIQVTGTGKNKSSKKSNNTQTTIRSAVQSVNPAARKAFKLPDVISSNSGNLNINAPIINITQGGVVTVENQGTGKAGKLKINADSIRLNETGKITASAESGKGGDIFLTSKNLSISHDSQITAAGIENSGKIIIDTNNLSTKKL